MKKRVVLLLGFVVLLAFAISISAESFGNTKTFTKGEHKYGVIDIKNSSGDLIKSYTLNENALDGECDGGGRNCWARLNISLREDGSLIDSIRFNKKVGDGAWGSS